MTTEFRRIIQRAAEQAAIQARECAVDGDQLLARAYEQSFARIHRWREAKKLRAAAPGGQTAVRATLSQREVESAALLIAAQWPKRCGCGAVYLPPGADAPTRLRWVALKPAYQRTDEYSTNEARHCPCGSTLEVAIAIHDPNAEVAHVG